MKESVTYHAILEEGREVGEQQGRLEEARRMLTILGSKRFGLPSAETLTVLDRVTRIEEMERLLSQLLDVESWADLLASKHHG